jgi:hypothetical protein
MWEEREKREREERPSSRARRGGLPYLLPPATVLGISIISKKQVQSYPTSNRRSQSPAYERRAATPPPLIEASVTRDDAREGLAGIGSRQLSPSTIPRGIRAGHGRASETSSALELPESFGESAEWHTRCRLTALITLRNTLIPVCSLLRRLLLSHSFRIAPPSLTPSPSPFAEPCPIESS